MGDKQGFVVFSVLGRLAVGRSPYDDSGKGRSKDFVASATAFANDCSVQRTGELLIEHMGHTAGYAAQLVPVY